jgi:hypothetical protein
MFFISVNGVALMIYMDIEQPLKLWRHLQKILLSEPFSYNLKYGMSFIQSNKLNLFKRFFPEFHKPDFRENITDLAE